MKRVFCSFVFASLLPLHPTDGGAGTDSVSAEFFRVFTSEGEPSVLRLTDGGWLSWSNSLDGGEYVIERTRSLDEIQWEPITRGATSNQIMSVKVLDPQPPPGMRFIPGGRFVMGNSLGDISQWAEPTNSVTVSPFYMGTYEVTVAELAGMLQRAFDQELAVVDGSYVQDQKGTNLMIMGQWDSEINFATNRFVFRLGRDDFPAHYISWFGAVSYCNWVSVREGYDPCYDLNTWECDFSKNGYRLPTEAEWEVAARGGYEGKRFPWPHKDTITHEDANYRSETNNWYDVSLTRGYHPDYYGAGLRPGSSPVGDFAPNNYGLYDMSGNVWEWVWDWSANYTKEPKINPTGPATGVFRIFRGGAWRTTAERTTCAVRYRSAHPTSTVNDVGFRILLPYRPVVPAEAGSPSD